MRRKIFIFCTVTAVLFSSCEKEQLLIPDKIIKHNSKVSAESDIKQERKKIRKNRRFWRFKTRKSDTAQYGNKKLFQREHSSGGEKAL
jgi:hypothetical protein